MTKNCTFKTASVNEIINQCNRIYTADVNLLGDNVDTIKKITETLVDASKEAGLDKNTQRGN
jgi:hypothetical protein